MTQTPEPIHSVRGNEIFISYAAEDVSFAKKLETAIRNLGQDPWIDLEDIPVGVDLNRPEGWQYIQDGIQNSDLCVVVLSPAFFTSQRCQKELDWMQKIMKRLIVVKWKSVEDLSLLNDLSQCPCIVANSAYPETTIDRVARIIVYIHIYDRLQKKADEWKQKLEAYKQEKDEERISEKEIEWQESLLRGVDLEAVELWVKQEELIAQDLDSLEIRLSKIQNQYIAASREQIEKQTKNNQTFVPSYQTYDAFISYSRQDEHEFVQQLFNQLISQGKKVWLDRKNIPVAAPWRQHIQEGIIAADNFIFVLSADSARSKNCREELILAIKNRKRLIGVVWRSDYNKDGLFEREACLKTLKDYNWINFNDPDNNPDQPRIINRSIFTAGLKKLIKAIETDEAHIAQHTRLLVQAQEWDTHKRSRDFLLGGRNTLQARSWLHQCGDKQPQPTQLQKEYILASTLAQRERFFGWTGIASLITIAILGLAGFGFTATRGRIEALVSSLEENRELDALITGLRAGIELKQYGLILNPTDRDLPVRVGTALQQQIYNLREQNRLRGHDKQVYNVNFSPDGGLMASASEDGTVRLWNRHGSLLRVLRPSDTNSQGAKPKIINAIFNPGINDDQYTLALATDSGDVYLLTVSQQKNWQPIQEQRLFALRALQDDPNRNRIYSLSFSPGGQVLAVGSADGRLTLWKRQADGSFGSKPIRTIDHPNSNSAILNVRFSPLSATGAKMAFADSEGKITVLTSQDEFQTVQTRTLEHGKNKLVLNTSFDPQGRLLASAGSDGIVKMWDLTNPNSAATVFEGHEDQVYQVSFSPDSNLLASASEDGSVRLWQVNQHSNDPAWQDKNGESSRVKILRGHQAGVYRVAFSRDGHILASAGADDIIRFWSTDGTEIDRLEGHEDEVLSIEFSPDGATLASSSKDNTIRLWKVGSPVRVLPHNYRVYDLSFSPDGSIVATSGQNSIRLWRTQEGTSLLGQPITLNKRAVFSSLSFAPVGEMASIRAHLLAAAANDGTITLWKIERQEAGYQPEVVTQIEAAHKGEVRSVSFSSDGQLLVSAGSDGRVKLWQLKLKNDQYQIDLLTTFEKTHPGGASSVSFSSDGQMIASAGADGVINVWTLQQQDNQLQIKFLRSLKGHNGAVNKISFSPDGNTIASAGQDRTVKLWQVRGMIAPKTLHGHDDAVLNVSFSPNDKLLASASQDDTIKLWTTDGTLISTLRRHQREVSSIEFSPDGETLASASYDARALLWKLSDTSLNQLLVEGCQLAQDYLQSNGTPTTNGEVLVEVRNYCENTLEGQNPLPVIPLKSTEQ